MTIYLTLDTNIWLELLKEPPNNINLFDELVYWVEEGHIKHLLPENIRDEWTRNKEHKIKEAVKDLKKIFNSPLETFKTIFKSSNITETEHYETFVRAKMDRIENIFQRYSEIIPNSNAILITAADRSLKCLAPNHFKDSFRDTVNIFSLISCVATNNFKPAYFVTLNYKDFSDPQNKDILHTHLKGDFSKIDLTYIYGIEKLWATLKNQFPNYQERINAYNKKIENKKNQQEKAVRQQKETKNLDKDYLENIKHIDIILAKNQPTELEQEILRILLNRHDSYKEYFYKKLAN